MSTTGRNWASLTAWNIGFWWSPFLACSAMNLSNEQLIMRIRTKLFHHLQSCSVESLLEMDCRTLRGLRRGKQGKTEWINSFNGLKPKVFIGGWGKSGWNRLKPPLSHVRHVLQICQQLTTRIASTLLAGTDLDPLWLHMLSSSKQSLCIGRIYHLTLFSFWKHKQTGHLTKYHQKALTLVVGCKHSYLDSCSYLDYSWLYPLKTSCSCGIEKLVMA